MGLGLSDSGLPLLLPRISQGPSRDTLERRGDDRRRGPPVRSKAAIRWCEIRLDD